MNVFGGAAAFGIYSTVLTLVGELGLLYVVMTEVRSRRPDAFSILALWAGLSLAGTVLLTFAGVIGSMVAARHFGVAEIATFYAVQTWVRTAFHLGMMALLGVGLVRLSKTASS